MVKCLVCQREAARGDCHIILPTAEDKAQLLSQGQEPLAEYVYCNPCWKTLSDPVAGPALIRGIFEGTLRQFGVGRAEELADKYHAWLVKHARRPRS